MPYYVYYCHTCKKEFDTFHGMTEKAEKCALCEATEKLEKKPVSITIIQENNIGTFVKDFITDGKEANKKEKERLSKQEYTK